MSKYVLITSAITNLILVICVLVALCRHHKFVKHQSESKENLVTEVRGIGFYVRIIAYIAIFFCLCVAIHYLAFMLPRLLDTESQNTHIQYLGVDYLGLIVAIFAIMVTLLVGWQIYSSIKVKDELKAFEAAKDDFRSDLDTHKQETSNKINEIGGKILELRLDMHSEIMLVAPLCISAHKDDIERLSEALRIYNLCSDKNFVANLFSREMAFGLLQCFNVLQEESRKKAITQIKEKCDNEAISKLYAEYLGYSEETKANYGKVSEIFLELLKK